MNSNIKLKRQLNLMHGIGIICGLIIGSGIYITPSAVIAGTGSSGFALILWAVCGIIGTFGALCFAELGTTFPQSGEKYAYLEEMVGPFVAFMYLITYTVISRPAGNSIKCLTFAQYLLQPFYHSCNPPSAAVSLIGICVACLLTYINIMRVRWAAHGLSFFVCLSACILTVMSVFGIIHVAKGNTEYITKNVIFKGTSSDPGEIALALYSAIFASSGWIALNFVVEELKNPKRNLPLALIISMILVTILYVTTNFAYLAVLGPEGVLQSNAVAVTFAERVMGPVAWVIPFGVAITTISSYNSGMLVGSRLSFVGGRRGHYPGILGLINTSYLSPIAALIFQTAIVIIMCAISDVFFLVKNVIFIATFFNMLAVIGMIYLRWKKPELERPFKLPLAIPITFFLTCVFLIIVPLIYTPRNVASGLGLMTIIGVPYYIILQCWNNGTRMKKLESYYGKAFTTIQKVLNGVTQEHVVQNERSK